MFSAKKTKLKKIIGTNNKILLRGVFTAPKRKNTYIAKILNRVGFYTLRPYKFNLWLYYFSPLS